MFDIEAINCVVIDHFEINLNAGTHTIEIYTKPGTIFGFTQNPAPWTLAATVNNVVSAGANMPTLVPTSLGVTVPAGQTVGFYITTINGGMRYTGLGTNPTPTGPTGLVAASDGNIQIMVGVGKSYPFDLDFYPRTSNLIATYSTCVGTTGVGCCTQPIMSFTDPGCAGASNGDAVADGQDVGPWDYAWEDPNGNIIHTENGVNGPSTVTGLAAGVYTVSTTDALGCLATNTVTLTDPPPLNVAVTSEPTLCNGSSDGTATATGEGVAPWTYQWFNAGNSNVGVGNGVNGSHTAQALSAGSYTVSVTDATGCGATGQIDVTEPAAITANQSQTDNLCSGDANGTATVSGVSGGVPGYTVTWDDINSQIGNTATGLPAGLYTALITDANGCELEQTFIIDQPDPFIITTTPATDTCGKSLGSIGVNVQGGTAPLDYRWAHGDSLQVADSLLQGTYYVVITDANGCKDSTQATIGNIPPPKAAFTFVTDPEDIFEYGVSFTNNSSNSEYYTWDFDDGSYSDEEHPEHTYDDEGTYGVYLISFNDYGCYDTVVGYVRIEPPFTMYIPNAFTPGKNGINDVFMPVGYGYDYDSFLMVIYDRWGDIVYQTNDISQGWDGTSHINGDWVPNGVYTYKISVKEPIGHEPKYFYGHVTMLKH